MILLDFCAFYQMFTVSWYKIKCRQYTSLNIPSVVTDSLSTGKSFLTLILFLDWNYILSMASASSAVVSNTVPLFVFHFDARAERHLWAVMKTG